MQLVLQGVSFLCIENHHACMQASPIIVALLVAAHSTQVAMHAAAMGTVAGQQRPVKAAGKEREAEDIMFALALCMHRGPTV